MKKKNNDDKNDFLFLSRKLNLKIYFKKDHNFL